MVFYVAFVVVYALLTFGAVQAHSALLICILWFVGFSVASLHGLIKGSSTTIPLAALVIGGAALPLVGPKLTAALLGGFAAWTIARRGAESVMRLFNILVIIGVLEALLGLVQFFVAPGWIFGYITASRTSGTLINKNHFSGLMGLLIPVCLGYALIGRLRYGDWARSYVYVLGGAFMAVALLFSLSRSGIFSFLITMTILGPLIRIKGSEARIGRGMVAGLLLLVLAATLWIGVDVIVQRYSTLLLDDDILIRDGRMIVFQDTVRMIAAHPWGVGPGKYQDVFRQFQTFRSDLLFDHAHNDYLETTAEFGLPLAILLWGGIGLILYRLIRTFLATTSSSNTGILMSCIGSVIGILIHSLTDFNLQIPVNAMLFSMFLGIGLATSRSEKDPSLLPRRSLK
jgi:O-antigen ligase